MKRDWVTMIAGPMAWFVALVASWVVTPPAHESGRLEALRAMNLVALAIAIIACALAVMRVRALSRLTPADRHAQRARFVAGCAVALSALSILLVIGLALPTFLLVPGAEP
jgi:thiol:disulfide interchange protein